MLDEVLKIDDKLRVRETCYGLAISGDQLRVEKVLDHLRRKYPHDFFIRECGPRLGGHRVFTGFLQTAGEYQTLHIVSDALRAQEGHRKEGDMIWLAPPLGVEVTKTKLMRCLLFPDKKVEVLLLHLKNKDVVVRCPDGKKVLSMVQQHELPLRSFRA